MFCLIDIDLDFNANKKRITEPIINHHINNIQCNECDGDNDNSDDNSDDNNDPSTHTSCPLCPSASIVSSLKSYKEQINDFLYPSPPTPQPEKTPLFHTFSLPITYLDESVRHSLTDIVKSDLELVSTTTAPSPTPTKDTTQKNIEKKQTTDGDDHNSDDHNADAQQQHQSVYSILFRPENEFETNMMEEWGKEYTTDTEFLKDSQHIVLNMGKYHHELTTTMSVPSPATPAPATAPTPTRHHLSKEECDQMMSIWKTLKKDDAFMDKFHYIEWDTLREMNYSASFLQTISVANIVSPALSLLLPFFILVIPFMLLWLSGSSITFSTYIAMMRRLVQKHMIISILNVIENFSWEQAIYVGGCLLLYLYQIYCNIKQFKRLLANITYVNETLLFLKSYFGKSKSMLSAFVVANRNMSSYRGFIEKMEEQIPVLDELCAELECVPASCGMNWNTATHIGEMLKTFYALHDTPKYEDVMRYLIGFHGYIGNIENIYGHYIEGNVGFWGELSLVVGGGEGIREGVGRNDDDCDDNVGGVDISGVGVFISISPLDIADEVGVADNDIEQLITNIPTPNDDNNIEIETNTPNTPTKDTTQQTLTPTTPTPTPTPPPQKIQITNQYHPAHLLETNRPPVKNDCAFSKNRILTGPNASGKTTYLKTTAINLILSQQLGLGFYDTCCFVPYAYFHSYINIPDTSARDSLFQAESRRCKDMLDIILNNDTKTHFCILDELYSGTNPIDATKTAFGFLSYLKKLPHVSFLLTTHYTSICERFQADDRDIENHQMWVIYDPETRQIEMTYRVVEGICHIEGAMSILKEMNYPEEILALM